jgi:nucleoid-associated protein YgaU
MSKEVVIAGAIVTACLGLIVVAVVLPKQKVIAPEVVQKVEPIEVPTPPNNDDIFGVKPQPDPLLSNNNNQFPPMVEPRQYPLPNPLNEQFPPVKTPFPQFNPPPVVELSPAKPVTSEVKTHIVVTGETLGEISQKYYGTGKNWKKIAEANKVDPSDLKVGQKLTIPVIEAPATTTIPAPELASGERTYTVQKGDSYYSIAKKELGNAARWKELEKLNKIPADDLRVGKVIKLPAKAAAVEPLAPGPEAPSAGDANVHVVKANETLSDISKMHYGTTTKWKEIVKANPGIDPEGLKVGQKIKLPEIAGAPKVPESTAGSSTTTESSSNPAATYTVKAGDTPASIATSQIGPKADWKKIVEANPGLDPKKLRIGQKLVIPGKTAPAEPTPPPAPFGGVQPAPLAPPATGGGQRPMNNGFPTPPPANGNTRFEAPLNAGGASYPLPNGTPPPAPGGNFSPSTSENSFGIPPSNTLPPPADFPSLSTPSTPSTPSPSGIPTVP